MDKHLILTVSSDDKPGVIKQIAQIVSDHNGNWLESKLTQLAGRFAGIIRITVKADAVPDLEKALRKLTHGNIHVQLKELTTSNNKESTRHAQFIAIGPDRQGIVLEITQALTKYGINVKELNTHCSSMPYSGDPLFEAEGTLSLPTETEWDQLIDQLDVIADILGIDLKIEETALER